MSSKKREIVLNGYCFIRFAHRITVTLKGNEDEEELKAVVKKYEEHYESSRRGGALYKGQWQKCLNFKECSQAVYAPQCETTKNQGKIVCSRRCFGRVFGAQKGQQVGGPRAEKPVVEKEAGHLPEATTEKELPLSKEEIEVLAVYQEGDSLQALAGKTNMPGGRLHIIIISILLKKHVATLAGAKLKSQQKSASEQRQ